MYKKMSARTRALLSACLNVESEDNNENDSDNIIEGSPQNSPEKLNTASTYYVADTKKYSQVRKHEYLHAPYDLKGVKLPSSDMECFENFPTNTNYDVEPNNIEAAPYSSLTPTPPLCNKLSTLLVDECMSIASASNTHEAAGEKSIEAPPYSPLTPRPLNNKLSILLVDECMSVASASNTHEAAGEKSIEAPPYSPLTPRPLNNKLSILLVDECMSVASASNTHEAAGEKSIEAPPYSPLTPRPLRKLCARVLTIQNMDTSFNDMAPESDIHKIISESDEPSELPLTPNPNNLLIPETTETLSSPLRAMTPETTQVFNLLAASYENDCETLENCYFNQLNRITSPVSPNITDYNQVDSDDSVQDPDFICNVAQHRRISSTSCDSTSEKSVSLITTLAEVHRTPDESEIQTTNSQPNQIPPQNSPETSGPYLGRPKKGRKLKYGEYNREERKKRKYLNLSYVNSKNKMIEPKTFLDYRCDCPKRCNDKVSRQDRLSEFKKFYELGSYVAQNLYLATYVKEKPVKRRYLANTDVTKKQRPRTFSREYYIKDNLVCKDMFLKTLQISSKKINTALSKKRSSLTDGRGNQAGHNKTPTEDEKFLMDVIKKIPTYASHYRRANCNDAKFLRSDMTSSKIYELYSEEAKSAGKKPLSSAKVKHVFLTKFNLRTKPLKKDTCNKCDYYHSKKLQVSEVEKVCLEDSHEKHTQKAQLLQNQLRMDMKLAKEDPAIETLTFDLQKTLPLPRIPTNVVFYKRQLWVYNLGIHSGSKDQAHCNIWVEGEAGRGSQEVGSCLIKHVMNNLDDGVKQLILWSDSCGGQNRNIKLTLMLKALLNDHPTLQQINLRFLESGHSFLPNDTDFGRIECALKQQQRLYTEVDYMNIMKTCKKYKPMCVHRMQKEDFVSSANLEKKIVNRKKTVDGAKVKWLDTKEIMLKKENMFSIFMREDLNSEYSEVNIKKNIRCGPVSLTIGAMSPLWPKGKDIPEAKLKDLKSLLNLVPEDAQYFYKNLTGNANIEDDIEGFSGEIDFILEEDDNID